MNINYIEKNKREITHNKIIITKININFNFQRIFLKFC